MLKDAPMNSKIWTTLSLRAFVWIIAGGLLGGIGLVIIAGFVLAIFGGGLFGSFISIFSKAALIFLHGVIIGAIIASFLFLSKNNFATSVIVTLYSFFGVGYLVFISILGYQSYQNKASIDYQYIQLRQAIREQRYEFAYYTFISPEYRQRYRPDQIFGFGLGDELHTLHPRRTIDISGNRATLYPHEHRPIFYAGPVLELEKTNGIWYFTGEWYYSYD